ncbi:hypothetical protein EC915_104411 [Pseudomonas sp. LP_7_YM]|nr:hypothetical protein EC915_104411 [Pseudomonas sp. LP_7_YM]
MIVPTLLRVGTPLGTLCGRPVTRSVTQAIPTPSVGTITCIRPHSGAPFRLRERSVCPKATYFPYFSRPQAIMLSSNCFNTARVGSARSVR